MVTPTLRWVVVAALLVAALPATAAAQDPAEEAAAAVEQPAISFRADFAAGYALTDGIGMNDHLLMGITVGPQFLRATPGKVAVAPIAAVTLGIAEGGQASLRVHGGLELAVGVVEDLELAIAVTGGYLRAWEDDQRAGPMARLGLGFKLLAPKGFYLGFEPISVTVLPPPPAGFTRYTSHVAVDMGVIKFGGRGP
jgi:hypothetical protein